MTTEENMALDRIREPTFSVRGLWLRVARIRAFVEQATRDFAIHGATARTPARILSGGNQQKVVLARVLSSDPRVLIAAQPVRGLDVAATRYVFDQLVAARNRDRAVLLFSSDLDHALSLADRILVLFGGRVAASLDARSATLDDLGRYMAGIDAMPATRRGEVVDG
jgi:simple sugar transport system ATP-binding protein